MVQSLLRAIELLEALKVPERWFSLAELAEQVQLPPSTIHRILQTFCEKMYVVRDDKTHLYRLGPALISLGMAAANNVKLQSAALPVLQKLSHSTGEDAFLVIPAGFKGLVLEKVEGPNNLKVIEKFGYEVDLHCGALRKTLLAYQTQAYLKDYIEHGLKRLADHTIVDAADLLLDLAKIREEGLAVSYGDYIEDAVGVGGPVFGSDGEIIASIGVISPNARVEKIGLETLKQTVKDCADELCYRMGYVNFSVRPGVPASFAK
ncbi:MULTISPECIES: IclR family transcriptional regulator [unclassified Anaerotruncus]|jgi:DNA-binding IclR family transcriptional regulator|uniref:IclR family transcriptional regulator n=1 Tax=unclassified Anaerotruncus TaxID=2641626 RepID=UPI00033516A8|nr:MULTISPECIES: IclR family transcriptional regulator [unclassified Anaerotruncus]MCI9161179.1 IclR family transcriptional regulator [Anaerotruncus sp.]NCE75977.1 IclR family transcriptional regulator [Anaerotruncus sp. X29]RKJ80490.1 IclR family transcriptional regulator [Anaerotruncus sp. 1XD22-93]EOS54689.1 hypothetical protein C814_03377 [Anaerotruncus sp. G3(2012)]MCI9236229.1 IclR family transcriptional regulator [Anaerotruncus sp.]